MLNAYIYQVVGIVAVQFRINTSVDVVYSRKAKGLIGTFLLEIALSVGHFRHVKIITLVELSDFFIIFLRDTREVRIFIFENGFL